MNPDCTAHRLRKHYARSASAHRSEDSGFTLIEMLFAMFIFIIMIGVLAPVFTQVIHESQETATQARLQELAKGTRIAYAKDAMVIDTTGANGAIVFTAEYSQTLGNQINTTPLSNGTETVTPTQAYPLGQPQNIQTGFYAIAGASGNSPLHLATDGFGQPIWVYVSPQMQAQYDGYTLYFHDIGYLSTNGLPASVTPQSQGVTFTCTVSPATEQYGCAFNLGTNDGAQHDLVTQVSGYSIESHLYKVTLDRMHKIAQAYSSYFTTQYLANPSRNTDIDYFAGPDSYDNGLAGDDNNYMEPNGTGVIPNTGDGNDGGLGRFGFPGENPDGTTVSYYTTNPDTNDSEPMGTFDGGAITSDLGLSLSSVTSAWGFQMAVGNGPNAPYTGCGSAAQNRDPLSECSQLASPPYTAYILAWAPGEILLADPVVGNY